MRFTGARQSLVEAIMMESESLVVEPQQMEQCGVEIVHMDGVLNGP
jgi:hypothetical protein